MGHQIVKTEIEAVITDKTMPVEEQVIHLTQMREEVRAQLRAATESEMVDDDNLGDDLKHLDEALKSIGNKPDSIEDSCAATL